MKRGVIIVFIAFGLIGCEEQIETAIPRDQAIEETKKASESSIPESTRLEIIDEYKSGIPFPEIVSKHNIDKSSVESILLDFIDSSWINPGMYKVGSDLEPGLYFIGAPCYRQISDDSSGSLESILESIIANDNCQSFGYIEVRTGEYFLIDSSSFILRQYIGFYHDVANLEGGTYWVGQDIPAGEYKICGTGYWQRTPDARYDMMSIIANGNYKK